jgi:hypothetical protein
VEVPALDGQALAVLQRDVANWREGAARDKWLGSLQPLLRMAEEFSRTEDVDSRAGILDRARAGMEAVGAVQKAGQRFLYSATNVIGEECVRDCNFFINDDLLNEVATEAAPWVDLWRDSYVQKRGCR